MFETLYLSYCESRDLIVASNRQTQPSSIQIVRLSQTKRYSHLSKRFRKWTLAQSSSMDISQDIVTIGNYLDDLKNLFLLKMRWSLEAIQRTLDHWMMLRSNWKNLKWVEYLECYTLDKSFITADGLFNAVSFKNRHPNKNSENGLSLFHHWPHKKKQEMRGSIHHKTKRLQHGTDLK